MKHTNHGMTYENTNSVLRSLTSVFYNSVQMLAFQRNRYSLQGDQILSNRSLLIQSISLNLASGAPDSK